jgi:hypothetical protein
MDGDELADAGGVYAGLVRDGGWLMGDDTRDLGIRAVLAAVAPGWERLDDGLWCVRVRRHVDDGEHDGSTARDKPLDGNVSSIVSDDPAQGAGSVDAEAAGLFLLGEEGDGAEFSHDPLHSGPDVDEVHEAAPDVAGAEGGLVSEVDVEGVADAPTAPEQFEERREPTGTAERMPPSPPLASEIAGADVHAPTIAPKRRGGRPKGSKNKAKVA